MAGLTMACPDLLSVSVISAKDGTAGNASTCLIKAGAHLAAFVWQFDRLPKSTACHNFYYLAFRLQAAAAVQPRNRPLVVMLEGAEGTGASALKDLIILLAEVCVCFFKMTWSYQGLCRAFIAAASRQRKVEHFWGSARSGSPLLHVCALKATGLLVQVHSQLPVVLVMGMSTSAAALQQMLPLAVVDLLEAQHFHLVRSLPR